MLPSVFPCISETICASFCASNCCGLKPPEAPEPLDELELLALLELLEVLELLKAPDVLEGLPPELLNELKKFEASEPLEDADF